MKPQINHLTWHDSRGVLRSPVTVALVTDLHDCAYETWLHAMDNADLIAVVGDLTNRHTADMPKNAERFLRDAASIAPVMYSIGNHEIKMQESGAWRQIMERSPAVILDNTLYRFRDDLVIGGLSSGEKPVNTRVLDSLEKEHGLRLLLCHHPEYFKPEILHRSVDLTLSGHAHGGQIRIFGQGVYAPGQGLFPRWTSGFYFDRRLLVSRGVGSHGLPRLFDPCELILLTLLPRE